MKAAVAISTESPKTEWNNQLNQWCPRIAAFGFLLIVFSTLFPFSFSFKEGVFSKILADSFNSSSDFRDQLGNILLFLPLGFGLTGMLPDRKLKASIMLAIVLLLSATLSSSVEILQVFLPLRASTISDLITNSFGGVLGFLCFYLFKYKITTYVLSLLRKSKKKLSLKRLTAAFIAYMMALFIISLVLLNATSFQNWDLSFPLLLGNEQTGDRPWKGYISKVYIANKAIAKKEVAQAFSTTDSLASLKDSLIASYDFTAISNTKNFGDLIWQGQPSQQNSKGVFLNSKHWLRTATATSLSQKIRETSQLTLSITFATVDLKQSGPARIISLSSDFKHHNFMLGQDKADLVFRLRTPLSEKTGTKSANIIHDAIKDTNIHLIIITYDGLFLQIYLDKLQNSYSFQIAPTNYKVLYYELIFIPLGSLLALIFTFSHKGLKFYVFLFFTGVLLPCVAVEAILAIGSSRSISLENLLTSVFVTAITLLIFTVQIPAGRKSTITAY